VFTNEAENGQTIIITRHGRPVAKLTPIRRARRTIDETIDAIIEFSKGKELENGVTTKDLINEGRRI
jgi:antitoxin (DNA-binding transcriptional repressor) of toxin-antitoxin stability system